MRNLKFTVIGLGFFGLNLALQLVEEGAEVIGVDRNENRVEELRDRVSHVVCMDTTDIRALRKLGLKEMTAVIVAIGEDFESSLLTTALLQEIGVKRIINRVTSPTHERLLKLMNITDLILPEADAAAQLAQRLTIRGLVGSFELSKDYSIFEISAPREFWDKTLAELDLRNRYSLNLVTLKRTEKERGLLTLGQREIVRILGVPTPDSMIRENDVLVLFGKEKDIRTLLEV
jgi:trk system potassium uptake protein TrkA